MGLSPSRSIAFQEIKIPFSRHSRRLHIALDVIDTHTLILLNHHRAFNAWLFHGDMRTFLADSLEAVSLKYSDECTPVSWRELGHARLEKMEFPSYVHP